MKGPPLSQHTSGFVEEHPKRMHAHMHARLRTGSELVRKSINVMMEGSCEEVALEAEVTNQGALRLYQGLGFIRDKRLHR